MKATTWGCEHETIVCEQYIEAARFGHTGLEVMSSGLIIHTQFPHMGATPDGIVDCACCGKGVLEIKCPYSCIKKPLLEATDDKQFFLELHDGMYSPKNDHSYYYQAQMQMKFSEYSYADFIVWREHELLVDRIFSYNEFINPRCACAARVTVVVLYVSPYTLFWQYARLKV